MIHLRHKWEATGAEQLYRGTILSPARPEHNPVTVILYCCPKCATTKTEERMGHWTLEQVRGES